MMKSILPLVLVCLLLCGCGAPASSPAEPTTIPTQAPEIPPQAVFAGRDGPLETYRLPQADAYALAALDTGLLVLSGQERTLLSLLSWQDLTQQANFQLDFFLNPQDPAFQLRPDGLSCYDPAASQILVLDGSLKRISRITPPEDLAGSPLLSPDRRTLYYCTGSALKAWDLDTGIRRMVKQLPYPEQTVAGVWEDLVQCTFQEDGQMRSMFLQPATGKTLCSVDAPASVVMGKQRYQAAFSYGGMQALVFGGDTPQLLLPKNPQEQGLLMPDGVVTSCPGSNGTQLTYYHLPTGMRSQPLSLPAAPLSITGRDGFVYLLTCAGDASLLHRWTPEASGETAAVVPYELQPNPDALAACQALARQIGDKYGLTILVGSQAAAVQPWDYAFQPEYQPGVLTRELELLDTCLAQYPASVLADTFAHFSDVKLCLVHSLTGTAPSASLEQANGLQFFQNTDAYVVLAIGRYAQQELYHELFHVMQTHILSRSALLDRWDELNPTDFSYAYGYQLPSTASTYLTPGSRAFVDAYSMSFPKEDQARILEYAMLPNQAALFQEPVLQQKLAAMCRAIRDAYGLKNTEMPLPWEQYLNTP